jgi:hypothetical protein
MAGQTVQHQAGQEPVQADVVGPHLLRVPRPPRVQQGGCPARHRRPFRPRADRRRSSTHDRVCAGRPAPATSGPRAGSRTAREEARLRRRSWCGTSASSAVTCGSAGPGRCGRPSPGRSRRRRYVDGPLSGRLPASGAPQHHELPHLRAGPGHGRRPSAHRLRSYGRRTGYGPARPGRRRSTRTVAQARGGVHHGRSAGRARPTVRVLRRHRRGRGAPRNTPARPAPARPVRARSRLLAAEAAEHPAQHVLVRRCAQARPARSPRGGDLRPGPEVAVPGVGVREGDHVRLGGRGPDGTPG